LQLKGDDLSVSWLAEEIRSRKEFIIVGRAARVVTEGFDPVDGRADRPTGGVVAAVATTRINSSWTSRLVGRRAAVERRVAPYKATFDDNIPSFNLPRY